MRSLSVHFKRPDAEKSTDSSRSPEGEQAQKYVLRLATESDMMPMITGLRVMVGGLCKSRTGSLTLETQQQHMERLSKAMKDNNVLVMVHESAQSIAGLVRVIKRPVTASSSQKEVKGEGKRRSMDTEKSKETGAETLIEVEIQEFFLLISALAHDLAGGILDKLHAHYSHSQVKNMVVNATPAGAPLFLSKGYVRQPVSMETKSFSSPLAGFSPGSIMVKELHGGKR